LSITDGRVLRWPLFDSSGGLDGIAIAHGETTKALAIDPKGRWIASAGDSQARLWRRMTPFSLMPAATLNLDTPATAMAFAERTWLIAHDDAIDVHTLQPQAGIIDSTRLSTGAAIAHLAVAADGAWLLAADTRGRLAAWRLDGLGDSLRPIRSWSQGAAISALAVDPSGTQVLVGDRQGGVRSLRLDTTNTAHALADHQGAVLALAISKGGDWLASSGADRRIHIRKAGDPEHRSRISQLQPTAIRSLTFLGEGTWLAARDNAGAITLHSTQSAAELHLGVRPGPPSGLFSDGSRRLYAVGDDGLIELWELRLNGGRPRITGVTELSGPSSSGASRWTHDPKATQLLSATPSGVLRLRPLQADGLVNLACQLQPARVEPGGPVPREFASSLCNHS
ncbi:MAG TPA: WD40 repeat domain-containing protein, partial [Nannocystis exedens]|nr:WD40 repeat domain-containing protein [Nannocystis exedens]